MLRVNGGEIDPYLRKVTLQREKLERQLESFISY
jgi:hypothetical protein